MHLDVNKLKDLAVSASGLVFDPATGAIFTANATGLVILGALRDGLDEPAIRDLLAGEFEVDAETAGRDLYDFLGQLQGCGLAHGA